MDFGPCPKNLGHYKGFWHLYLKIGDSTMDFHSTHPDFNPENLTYFNPGPEF